MSKLRAANDPPEGKEGLWTERVLVQTSLGNIFAISYYNGTLSGVWQRPGYFEKDEVVIHWMPLPSELA
jgi:hypothetical protein